MLDVCFSDVQQAEIKKVVDCEQQKECHFHINVNAKYEYQYSAKDCKLLNFKILLYAYFIK